MSNRNNPNRTGAGGQPSDPASILGGLDFVTPTEFVELPSKGQFYSEGHPLHNQEVIEIKFMTAKDEDILTSQSLLKKGLAIDRFLQNVIVDKSIKPDDLLIGDKNAVLIAARVSGYGDSYDTIVGCPACASKNQVSFDLTQKAVLESQIDTVDYAKKTTDGTFLIKMPFSNLDVEFKLLTGKDENDLAFTQKKKAKGKMADSIMTDQYKKMIISVGGNNGRDVVNYYVDNMPLKDSSFLKATYRVLNPDVKIMNEFECTTCGHEQPLEVPFGADFFWPDR